MEFCLLGLGSSEYVKYQGFPKTVMGYLTKLGASMLGVFGQADELNDQMRTVTNWQNDLWRWLAATPLERSGSVEEKKTNVTIMYASKSGNTLAIAESLRDLLKSKGFPVGFYTMNQYEQARIEDPNLSSYFVLLVPTVDYGKMPPNGE